MTLRHGGIFSQLALVYEALIDGRPSPLPEEIQIQYLDYAVWERARANSPSRSDQAEVTWWRHALDSLPAALELPFSRPEPQSDAAAVQPSWWGFPPSAPPRWTTSVGPPVRPSI